MRTQDPTTNMSVNVSSSSVSTSNMSVNLAQGGASIQPPQRIHHLLCRHSGCTTQLRRDRITQEALRHGLCTHHYNEYKREHRSTPPVHLPPLVTTPASPSASPFIPRKPHEQLQKRQQYNRKHLGEQLLQEIDLPVRALSPNKYSPAEVQHLGNRERRKLRPLNLIIPGDQTMKEFYKEKDKQNGTECKEFELGAYVVDPLLLIQAYCSNSPFISVAGDYGGGTTKFGIIYQDENELLQFIPLYVINKPDDIASLLPFRGDYFPFTGVSSHLKDVWSMLQYFIDHSSTKQPCFLTGDWSFLNTILGLLQPGAVYPCPICLICKDDFTSTAEPRQPTDKHSRLPTEALLNCPVKQIVPLPLHLFLGFGNRVLSKILSHATLIQNSNLTSSVNSVKQCHTRGCGGLADLNSLNGPELKKFFQQHIPDKMLKQAVDALGITTRKKNTNNIKELNNLTQAFDWVRELESTLLSKKEFSIHEIEDAITLVEEIITRWSEVTGDNPFPKLHMLRHVAEFLQEWKFLGRVGEGVVESSHAKFNKLYHNNHFNLGNNTNTRLLRTLQSVLHDICR